MRSFFKILFLAAFVTSCGSSLNVVERFNDEFKKSEKVVLTQGISVSERRSAVQSALVTYEKEKFNSSEKLNLYVVLQRNIQSFKLEKAGFLKTAQQSFAIEAHEILNETHSKTETSTAIAVAMDSTRSVTLVNPSSETSTWQQDRFKIVLSAEMGQALRQGSDLTLRFYAGAYPITLVVKGKNWKKVQELLRS